MTDPSTILPLAIASSNDIIRVNVPRHGDRHRG